MILNPKIKAFKCNYNINDLIYTLSQYKGFSILDSCDRDKWTIIGIKPFKTLKLSYKQHPWKALNSVLSKYKVKHKTALPLLVGGIGYFGYELNQTLEKIEKPQKDDINIPDLFFNFYKNLIIYNNKTQKLSISYCDQNFLKLILHLKIKKKPKSCISSKLKLKSNLTQNQYNKAYFKIKEHIKIGDVYQINLAQRLNAKIQQDPIDIYLNLRNNNPVPYAAYLKNDDFNIISTSPELFLKLENKKIEIRPIKGTIPRGTTKKQDLYYRKLLLNSNKDKAELDMITDLERNDLSKVSKPGSVKVKKIREIKAWSTIWHTESLINARLEDGYSNVDLIKACFPCGSITGCPKIRAMEIIRSLEPNKRSVYTGSIGYISFNGDMELSVAIRTIINKKDQVYFSVGGGIVYNSTANGEYQETFDKAKAIINSLS